ncbi:interferon regulatory factor 4-like isoform X2 [Rhineura floridana]|uniref:interferon regulatory factor 4-like isoform X2 n=1 Tax=Rhineura floridana TaxID=261503 RepID=UPI002AC834E8|nr:interferon regulatory factor 4-like isoform X2 [Rhineura floridana]
MVGRSRPAPGLRAKDMADPGPPMRLKEWLIAQVESGRYPGLRWENHEKTLFRIPWKHAAKQDYRQQEDAALFKAWAIYKGKYHEGLDKADPTVWKTRLRCALNKSTDFKEVPSRSHLDISEPYKVYQVILDASQETGTSGHLRPQESADKENGKEPSEPSMSAHQETRADGKPKKARAPSDSGLACKDEPGETLQTSPVPSQAPQKPNHGEHQDCWLHVRLYYCDVLVKEATTKTAEGCRITYCPVPADNERLYGPNSMEQIQFPSTDVLAGSSQGARAVGILQRLLPHLHRGVLLWVAPEGVFMKRQCQGRVYWKGPLAPNDNQPNKLEREKTYKLLDMQEFLHQLKGYLIHGGPLPQYQIHFCFGEEYPAAPNQKLHKFIMARVEPAFAHHLCLHAQQLGPRSLQDSQVCNLDAPRNIIQILKQLGLP